MIAFSCDAGYQLCGALAVFGRAAILGVYYAGYLLE